MQISGRRVLITGASRGIGRALAERFAAAGAQLALVARSEGPLKELAERLGGRPFSVDLCDSAAVEGLIERVETDGGGIDILVNNAGISNIGYVLHQSPRDIEDVFRTNALTPIHLCRQVIPRMLERGGGHIVNMSSLAAVMTPPGLVLYGSSKAALSHYTAGLRQDLRGLPITTTLVQIGSVDTELDDQTRAYRPYQEMLRRTQRGSKPNADRISMEILVDGIIDAVLHERRHVRYPKSLRVLPALVEIPRRLTELLFRRIDPRP